jgi:hypothetical protein
MNCIERPAGGAVERLEIPFLPWTVNSMRMRLPRASSSTIGASMPGPIDMVPVMRSERTARILSSPPRAATFFAMTSSTVSARAAGTARRRAIAKASGSSLRMGGLLTEPDGDELRDAGLLHGNAVELVRDLHRLARVRDQHDLRLGLEALEQAHEAADVRVVERASTSSRMQNGDGLYWKIANSSEIAVRAFSPPESSMTFCRRLPRRLRHHVDAALQHVLLVEQRQARPCRRRRAA